MAQIEDFGIIFLRITCLNFFSVLCRMVARGYGHYVLLQMKKSEFDMSKLLLIIAFYNNGRPEQIKNMASPCEVPTISVLKVKTCVSSSLVTI